MQDTERDRHRLIHAQAAHKVHQEAKGRNALGSLIGKKRKERKRKHSAA